MNVFTTPIERVDATLTFMRTRCSATLLSEIDRLLLSEQKKKATGSYIKLGMGFDCDQRRALRSLLLCHYLLVEARDDGKLTEWGKVSFGSKDSLKKFWKDRPTLQILDGVAAYDHGAGNCLADALESLGKQPGDTAFKYYDMARPGFRNLGAKEAICYQSIALGLWLAGHASLPWLATWYASLNAGNCFDILGPGEEVVDAQRILPLRGTVISFRAREVRGAQTVNHWGVIVSDGCAVGSNTDGFRDQGSTTEGVEYEFRWGKRRFAKFDILECIEACKKNTKYSDSGGVRVATHRIGDMKLW